MTRLGRAIDFCLTFCEVFFTSQHEDFPLRANYSSWEEAFADTPSTIEFFLRGARVESRCGMAATPEEIRGANLHPVNAIGRFQRDPELPVAEVLQKYGSRMATLAELAALADFRVHNCYPYVFWQDEDGRLWFGHLFTYDGFRCVDANPVPETFTHLGPFSNLLLVDRQVA